MPFRERQSKKTAAKRVAIFGSVAAGAGYLAGLLTAPNSGKHTRDTIKQATGRSYAEAEKDLKQVNKELTKLIKEAQDSGKKLTKKAQAELDEILDMASNSKEKGREMLSAIHDGGAEDKELKKAIKEADSALKHLRNYLKK